MTAFLPPNLLALFAPRDPIPYLAPVDKLCHEKKKVDVTGVSQFLKEFEDPKDTPPPTRVETKDERKERKKKERNEQIAYKLEQDLALWDPHNDPEGTSDPFKTLFVARVNFDTSESKLRREFEVYGPIRKIRQVHDSRNAKVRGFAFIEYEHERDMHSAYKHADGKKIDGRRVLVDVERGRTVKGWRPRRLGGGLGGTRKGGPEENTRFSGRDEFGGGVGGFGGRDDRGGGGAGGGRSRSRERDREPRRRRSRSRERKPRGRSRSRSREPMRRRSRERRPRSRDRERSRERGPEEGEPEEDGRPRKRREEGEPEEDGRPRKRRDEVEPDEDRDRNRRTEVEAGEEGRERNRRNEEPDDENRSRKRSRRSRSRERTKRSRSRERKTRRRSRSRERRERRPEEGGEAPPGGDNNGEEFQPVRIKVEKEVEGYGIYPGPEAVALALNGAELKEEPVENEFEEQYGDY